MNFRSQLAPQGWRPQVGERVIGKRGKNRVEEEVEGCVMESYRRPGHVAAFSRYGYVGLYIQLDDGRRVAVNEVRPYPTII